MFHLTRSAAAARPAGSSTAVRVVRRRFGSVAKPNPKPDTRPPAVWGAKPGYKKWQPVPDEIPSLNVYRFWGYKLFEGFFVGMIAGVVLGLPYAIIKERQIKGWHESTKNYLADMQKNRVDVKRAQLAEAAKTPWWFSMSGKNEVDLNEMIRFVRSAQAEDDIAAYEILMQPKPWDAKTEALYREAMLDFSEYPNYYNMQPDFTAVHNYLQGNATEEDDDDEEEDDDE